VGENRLSTTTSKGLCFAVCFVVCCCGRLRAGCAVCTSGLAVAVFSEGLGMGFRSNLRYFVVFWSVLAFLG